MVDNSHSYFLNQLLINSAQRRLFFDVRVTAKTKSLASILVQLNVLRRFHKQDGNQYRIFPAYTRYRRRSRPIKTYARVNGRIRFKLKTLQTINTNTPHSYYILETPKGLMTHKEALRNGTGGLLLLIVR